MKIRFSLFILALLFYSCSKEEVKRPTVTSKDELYVYLDSLEARYEKACVNIQLVNLDMLMKRNLKSVHEPKTQLASIFLDTSTFKIITEWRDRSGSLADKLLARRLNLWYRLFVGGKLQFDPEIVELQNELQREILKTKYFFDDIPLTADEISSKLRTEINKNKRKKIWQIIIKQNIPFEQKLKHLITLRNEKSQMFGFHNYYSLMLYLQAIDEEWLLKTINSIEEITRPEYVKIINLKKKNLHLKKLHPWDTEFITNDLPTLSHKYFPSDSVLVKVTRFEKAIGFRIDTLDIITDISSPLTFSATIKIPVDIRVLIGHQKKGIYFYKTVFREYGNALRAIYTDVSYPILKGYNLVNGSNNVSFENGIASLHSSFLDDSLGLSFFIKLNNKGFLQYQLKRNMAIISRLRKSIKLFFSEYELYNNPNVDIGTLESELLEKIFDISLEKDIPLFFESLDEFVDSPCSSHNYILSEMIAAQLHEAMVSKFGIKRFSDTSVASWLIKNLYSPGEKIEWAEKIRNATGKSLEPGAMLRKYGIEHMKLTTKEIID